MIIVLKKNDYNTSMQTVQMFTKISLKNGFRGAQVKTWDFFQHIKSHADFDPHIAFHPDSQWSVAVPWSEQQVVGEQVLLNNPDYYLLKGGNDWRLFLEQHTMSQEAQVISPIVNFRVVNFGHYSSELLKLPAIRVCPSPALTNRLLESGMVNGPVHFIANGIDTELFRGIKYEDKTTDLLIVAFKNPEFGKQLAAGISGPKHIKVLSKVLPQATFIDEMAQAKIIIHCPQKVEAHYLPGLEGMLQGAVTIIPDCLGNTFYIKHGEDAFVCDYDLDSIIHVFNHVYHLSPGQKFLISSRAQEKSKQYSLEQEKQDWHELLNQLKR